MTVIHVLRRWRKVTARTGPLRPRAQGDAHLLGPPRPSASPRYELPGRHRTREPLLLRVRKGRGAVGGVTLRWPPPPAPTLCCARRLPGRQRSGQSARPAPAHSFSRVGEHQSAGAPEASGRRVPAQRLSPTASLWAGAETREPIRAEGKSVRRAGPRAALPIKWGPGGGARIIRSWRSRRKRAAEGDRGTVWKPSAQRPFPAAAPSRHEDQVL